MQNRRDGAPAGERPPSAGIFGIHEGALEWFDDAGVPAGGGVRGVAETFGG
jgi:hypothetical protein